MQRLVVVIVIVVVVVVVVVIVIVVAGRHRTGIPLHCYAIGSACAKTSGSRRASRNLYPFVAGVVGGTAACYIYVGVVNL